MADINPFLPEPQEKNQEPVPLYIELVLPQEPPLKEKKQDDERGVIIIEIF